MTFDNKLDEAKIGQNKHLKNFVGQNVHLDEINARQNDC